MKNLFKKKVKSSNPDINKGLLNADAGLGMQPQNRPMPQPSPTPTEASKDIERSKVVPKRLHKDKKEGYDWDFCLVLPNPEDDQFKEKPIDPKYQPPLEILRRLHTAGLETYQYYSGDWDEIFIKIRAPLDVLRSHAKNMELKMLLDSNYIKRHIENMKEPIGTDENHTKLSPYEFIYASYDDTKRQMFARAAGYDHPFSSIIRVKLIMDIINNDEEDCCSLNLRRLVMDGSRSILHYFPLHDTSARDSLARIWFGWRVNPWQQPLRDVKEYVGEKIGLYFAFTGHYTTWLVPLCLASVAIIFYFFVLYVSEGTLVGALSKGFMVPFFCIFVAVWAQLMLEYWKRKQNRLAMEWGQTEFEEEEDERPEFEATSMRPSLMDGKLEKYFNPAIKSARVLHSISVIAAMIMLVLCCVSVIFYLQYYMNSDQVSASVAPIGNAGVSILAALQIVLLNMYYSGLATDLNDKENHRTDTEYDDALIAKLYVFMFVNSYASLYFIAFIKTNVGVKCQGPCMVELAIQLTVIFAMQLTVSKITAYFEIVVNTKLKAAENDANRQKRLDEGKDVYPMSKAEKEAQLEDYDPSLSVIGDYSTIVIQYGYVTLFVAACPLAPMLAYASNYAELRLDGYKLLYLTKRPVPVGAEDIGTWQDILQITSVAAVVTNAALVVYTMDLTNDFSDVGQLWIFIGFQYTIFVIMAIFAYLVDDMPEEVAIQLGRQQYLQERATQSEQELRDEDEKIPSGASRPVLTAAEEEECVIHRTEGAEEFP